jgi:hypothetical protein
METVGFIGLGNMGGPVAGHIQRAGYPMVVYDLRAEATRPFQARGAAVAGSAAELAVRSDVIITALPLPRDVEQVAGGNGGIIAGIRAGSIYIDISTSPPSLIRELEPRFTAKERSFSTRQSLPASRARRAAFTKSWSAARGKFLSGQNRYSARSETRFCTPGRWDREASASSCIR